MENDEIFPKGTKIGFQDVNGNELSVGDKVKIMKIIVLPNWDGWGRDIPSDGKIHTQTNEYVGIIEYLPERGEFVCHIENWTKFSLFEFEKIELLKGE